MQEKCNLGKSSECTSKWEVHIYYSQFCRFYMDTAHLTLNSVHFTDKSTMIAHIVLYILLTKQNNYTEHCTYYT